MAKKKIYAVRKGHKTGLFYTWDECKKAVYGYSGAEYKGFLTKEEAEAFLNIGAAKIITNKNSSTGSNWCRFHCTNNFDIRQACCLCGWKF